MATINGTAAMAADLDTRVQELELRLASMERCVPELLDALRRIDKILAVLEAFDVTT